MTEVFRAEVNADGSYGVYVRDPDLAKRNSEKEASWTDPWVEYHAKDAKTVAAFFLKIAPKLKSEQESTMFDAAWKEATKGDKDE